MGEFIIRTVTVDDAERLVEIYSYYVENTAVSFEYVTPSVEEFRTRIQKIGNKYPYIVCEKDGKILGYAYAGRYGVRAAYDWTVTTSIYVDKDTRCMGVGRALYDELEKRLSKQGIRNLMAAIAYREEEDEYLTHDSILFHEKLGYERVACMKEVGKKFDRWYDLIWDQKQLF